MSEGTLIIIIKIIYGMTINPAFSIIESYSNGLNKNNIFINHVKNNITYRINSSNPLINHIDQLDKCINTCKDVCKLRADDTSYFLDPFDLPVNDLKEYQKNNNKAEELSIAVKDNQNLLEDLKGIKKDFEIINAAGGTHAYINISQLIHKYQTILRQNKYHNNINNPSNIRTLGYLFHTTLNLTSTINIITNQIREIESTTSIFNNDAITYQNKANDLVRVSKTQIAEVLTNLINTKNAVEVELKDRLDNTIKSNIDIQTMMHRIKLMWEEFWKSTLKR